MGHSFSFCKTCETPIDCDSCDKLVALIEPGCMTLEELKAEAKRQGYKLIKAKRPRFEQCLCGHNVHREQVEKVWKPRKVCNGKTTLYQHTNTTKLFMNTFGKATTLVTECNGCPPYADCCMKGISMNSAFRISYCPECGRPLTDKAVDMVMERLEALGYGKDD